MPDSMHMSTPTPNPDGDPGPLDKVALGCAIWFALTSWNWAYLMNVWVSLPAGLIATGLWLRSRKRGHHSTVSRATGTILVFGTISAAVTITQFQ